MEPAFTTSSSPTRYHRHAETTFGRIADPEEASRRWLPSSRPPRGVEIKTKPHAVVTPPLAHSSSARSTVRWLRKGFSHTCFASATLKSFQRTLALSRSIEVSRLIVVHRGAIIEGDASQTLVSLGLQDGSIVHAFAREPTTVRPSRHSAAKSPGCVRSAWQHSSASGPEVPLQPRAASGFLSTMAPVDARVGWASWSKSQSQSPSSGRDLDLDVVELGYVPFETSGEALQASRWDLESQASTRELESHVVSELQEFRV